MLSLANVKYSRKTSEEKKQEVKELSEKAFAQIESYTSSPDDLLEYADFLSRFHSYSLNNMSLIENQFSGARAVASFKDWKDHGYSVNKGEKGIEILSYTPITLFKDSQGETKQLSAATKTEKESIKRGEIPTRRIPAFKKGHVFDVSQTNAPIEDLPKIFPNRQYNFQVEEGNNAAHLKKGIEALAKEMNIEIRDMKQSKFGYSELGAAKGIYLENPLDSSHEILLNSRNTETQNLATSIHELAHRRLHHMGSEYDSFDTPTKEFQAELTSYIVCKHYGMDTSEKAIPYIARWTKNGTKLEDKQKAMEGVHVAVGEFINTIDPIISQEKERETEQINCHDELLLIQENYGVVSNKVELENTEFWRKLESIDPEDYNKYLTYKPLYEQEEKDGSLEFKEPVMYIHGVSNEFESFGEMNSKDLSPYKYAEVIYTVAIPKDDGKLTTVSGKYDSADYAHPLHHIQKNELLNKESISQLENNWHEHLAREEANHLNQWQEQFLHKGSFQPTVKEAELLYPIDEEELMYCNVTGKAIAQDEGYYHLENGMNLSEEAKRIVYTDKEWDELSSDDGQNYWTTSFYDVDESEMTTKEPEGLNLDGKNKYYFYDGQSKPVALGTFSEIVSAAEKQELIGHFSFSHEFVRDLTFNRSEEKSEFNEQMEKHHVLKNPSLKDFQRVNETLGLEQNQNLSAVQQDRNLQIVMKHQAIER